MTPPASPFPSSLRPHHVALLRDSGLSDASIAARGYQTAQFKQALTEAGFSPWQARHVPALLIPIYDVRGQLAMYQMRPDVAPEIDDKPLKYMTPKGGALCLDVPRSVQPLLALASVPLWITEGSKKVDAAVQHGLCCIGALGVTGWCHNGGVPREDWEHIALEGRTVYIAFDADLRRKWEVWQALQALQTYLRGRGAQVLIVYLPDDTHDANKKIGLDDFLAGGGTVEQLIALASSDLCACPSKANSKPRNPLEMLRAEKLTQKLRGLADVLPHGGIDVYSEASLSQLEKAAENVSFFYGRIEEMEKWDLIDVWMAVLPKLLYQERLAWKAAHFGRFAKRIGEWVSRVGSFAQNADNRRRPHLPFWLHEYVRDLTPDQQELIFNTFEDNSRMGQAAVMQLIAQLTGAQPKSAEKKKTPTTPIRPRLEWEDAAQHIEAVPAIGGNVAPHMLRVISKVSAQFLAEYILACPAEGVEIEGEVWAGRDVTDTPPEPPAVNEADFWQEDANEIENSRQNSRQTFADAKVEAGFAADDGGEKAAESASVFDPQDSAGQTAGASAAVTFRPVLIMGGENLSSPNQNENLAAPDAAAPQAALSILERRAAPAEYAPRRLASVGEVLTDTAELAELAMQAEREIVFQSLMQTLPAQQDYQEDYSEAGFTPEVPAPQAPDALRQALLRRLQDGKPLLIGVLLWDMEKLEYAAEDVEAALGGLVQQGIVARCAGSRAALDTYQRLRSGEQPPTPACGCVVSALLPFVSLLECSQTPAFPQGRFRLCDDPLQEVTCLAAWVKELLRRYERAGLEYKAGEQAEALADLEQARQAWERWKRGPQEAESLPDVGRADVFVEAPPSISQAQRQEAAPGPIAAFPYESEKLPVDEGDVDHAPAAPGRSDVGTKLAPNEAPGALRVRPAALLPPRVLPLPQSEADLEAALHSFAPLLIVARKRGLPGGLICVDAAAGVTTEDLNIFVIRQVNACKAAWEAGERERLGEALRLLELCEGLWQAEESLWE